MLVLFFLVCSLISLLVSLAVDAVIARVIDAFIAKALAAITTIISSLPWVPAILNFSAFDMSKIQGSDLPGVVVMAADNPIARSVIAQNLAGISFLQVQANGRLKDLFDESSVYHGMTVDEMTIKSSAETGRSVPVLLVDAAKVGAVTINSPGPVFVYGEGKTVVNVRSKLAIFLANEKLSAAGSTFDAPIVIASQLDDGNELTILNSASPNHLVRLIPFSELRGGAKTAMEKMLKGEPFQNNFSFEGLGREMASMDVPPPPTTSALLKTVKCEPGFFFLRCHVRFDREIVQGFVNKFATPDVTSWTVDMWGAKLNLGVQKPRVSINEGQIRLLLDLNLVNQTGGSTKASSTNGTWQGLVDTVMAAHRTALQSIPNLQIRNVEVVIEKIRYDRSTGKLYVGSAKIMNFDSPIPLPDDVKTTLLSSLNDVIPRYLATNPIYDLNDIKLFGFIRLARRLVERIDIDPHDQLRLQVRFGPTPIRKADRVRECNTDLQVF
jgi:hypothetical protein